MISARRTPCDATRSPSTPRVLETDQMIRLCLLTWRVSRARRVFTNKNVSDDTARAPSASRSTSDPLPGSVRGGRGCDDATTWQEYGSAAIGVSRALTTAAEDGHVDAAFLFGDLSYAVGYGSVWDEFCEQITPFASRVPLLTSLGNHDFDGTAAQWAWMRRGRDVRSAGSSGGGELDASATRSPRDRYGRGDSGGECGVPSSVRFPTPGRFAKKAAPGGGWFAVTLGPFRVVSMNTEVRFEKGSAQYAFLESALSDRKLDRSKTPFVVVVAHRPVLVDSFTGGTAAIVADDDARATPATWASRWRCRNTSGRCSWREAWTCTSPATTTRTSATARSRVSRTVPRTGPNRTVPRRFRTDRRTSARAGALRFRRARPNTVTTTRARPFRWSWAPRAPGSRATTSARGSWRRRSTRSGTCGSPPSRRRRYAARLCARTAASRTPSQSSRRADPGDPGDPARPRPSRAPRRAGGGVATA